MGFRGIHAEPVHTETRVEAFHVHGNTSTSRSRNKEVGRKSSQLRSPAGAQRVSRVQVQGPEQRHEKADHRSEEHRLQRQPDLGTRSVRD